MAMSANGCSNDIPDRVCDKFLEDGKCNFGFAKEKCAKGKSFHADGYEYGFTWNYD